MDYYTFIVFYMLVPYSISFVITPHKRHLLGDTHDIVFPDDSHERRDDFIPKVRTKPCPGPTNFCEDVVGYPQVYVENSLKEKAVIYEDMFVMEGLYNDEELRTIKNDDGINCATKREWMFPKIGLNIKNQWKYIYNTDKHKQGIYLEYCESPGSQCINNPLKTFKSECNSKYVPYRLLTIGYDGNLEGDTFMQAVSCCCSIKPIIVWNGS